MIFKKDPYGELLRMLPSAPDFKYDFDGLRNTAFGRWFDQMAKTKQNPVWHGEGDVWTHTQMVCAQLVKMPQFRALPEHRQQMMALAALLHDVGKIPATRLENGEWTSPHHGSAGAQMVRQVLWTEFDMCGTKEKQLFRETVCALIRYHMQPAHIFQIKNGERKMLKIAANGLLMPDFTWEMICLLALADVQGRIADCTQEQIDNVLLCREMAQEAGCLNGIGEYASDFTRRAYLSGRNVHPLQLLYEDCWGEVVMLCGLPGTGKDTWIEKNLSKLPMISLDDLRVQMKISPTDNQGRVVQAAQNALKEQLRKKQPFVYNATNLTADTRAKFVKLFENYGAKVHIVYLETEWNENLRRNSARKAVVPEAVIGKMLSSFQIPEAMEAQSVEWLCV